MDVITGSDIEQLVIDNGCPETLIVPATDFKAIYLAYRQVNRDDKGVFVLCLHTKIRPPQQAEKTVDLGAAKASVFAKQ